MSDTRPIVYLLDASRAVTGALVAASATARLMGEELRIVLVIPRGAIMPSALLAPFWRVETMRLALLSRHFLPLIAFLPRLCANAFWLRQRMARDGAGALLLNDFYLMQGTALRMLGFRGTVIQWVRCQPFHYAGNASRLLLWSMKRSANRIVTVSRFIQQVLAPAIQADCITDCFNGTARAPALVEPKLLLYVANYIPGKGQEIAIDAFAQVAHEDTRMELHFYGADMGLEKNRAYRMELEHRAKQTNLAHRIHFHAFTEDTAALHQRAFCALNFSVSESFSLTVLEASGCGVPVVATASGGPQEIIVDGVTGFIVPVGDARMAADKIRYLLEHPEQAAAIGVAAASHIQTHFAPETTKLQLRKLLSKAL